MKTLSQFFLKSAMILTTIALTATLFSTTIMSSFASTLNPNEKITITARNENSRAKTLKDLVGSFYPTQSGVFFVLVIGNDYRPGVEGRRADGIHLLGINSDENKVTMINFPRDTTVAIPGFGRNKINAANAFGGSALTAQTLEQLTGVKISYILEADFAAFTGLVNDLGGLDITVEKPMKDKNSGTNFDPGVIRMNGDQALAFSRDRYSFSNGDISRSQNQGRVLIAALAEMKKERTTISSRFEAAGTIAKRLQLTNMTVRDLFFLMEQAEKIAPENITNLVVPWSGSNTLAPKANDLFTDFKDNAILDTYIP